MKNVRWLTLLAILVALSGCGYRWMGQDSPLPPAERRLLIDPLNNRTTRAFLEQLGTAALVERFARTQRYELCEDRAQASLQLSGVISDYRSRVAAYDRLDRITAYRLEVTVEATLRRLRDGRVLWKGKVQGGEDYLADPDRGQQQIAEDHAAGLLLERLADDLYARLADDY